MQQVEKSGDDGHDSAPLRALVQAPCGQQCKSDADHYAYPYGVEDCLTKPLRRHGTVKPRAIAQVAEVVGNEGVEKGEAGESLQDGVTGVKHPNQAQGP